MTRGAWLPIASVLAVTAPCLAEPAAVDVRNFAPPVDPSGTFALEPTTTPGPGEFNLAWITSYAYRALVLVDDQNHELGVPLGHQLSADLVVASGLGRGLSLGLAFPVALVQDGDPSMPRVPRLPRSSVGDARLEGKLTLVGPGPLGGFGFAAVARAQLPTGSAASYVSSHGTTGQLGLLSELDLILATVRAELGFLARAETARLVDDDFGHALPFAAGISLRPQVLGWDAKGTYTWFIETRGQLSVTPEFLRGTASPVMVGLGARKALSGDLSLLAGVELPLNDAVGAPAFRAVLGLGYAPRYYDADSDGIPDDADDCPEGMPEDRDGFEDDDGCPDDDNDMDGVPDTDDRCPLVPEDEDGFEDRDGCPEPDNDGDGIADTEDACPLQPGVASPSPKHAGCPPKDTDGDGLTDDVDRCPTQPEDKDGFEDDDGCPDLDHDRDGVKEPADACPQLYGARRMLAALNGCPDPDADHDTFFGNFGDGLAPTELEELQPGTAGTPRDLCPNEPEDFDGVKDTDGCPEPEPKPKRGGAVTGAPTPLVVIEFSGKEGQVRFARAPVASRERPVPTTAEQVAVLRALAHELRLHPEFSARIAVVPTDDSEAAKKASLDAAGALARQLELLTLRAGSARAVAYAGELPTPKTTPPVVVSITWPKSHKPNKPSAVRPREDRDIAAPKRPLRLPPSPPPRPDPKEPLR